MNDGRNTGNVERNVVIFGFGRSGTTWLAEIVAAAGLELLFEPLNRDRVPLCSSWKPLPLYHRDRDAFPWEADFARIMAGAVRNDWIVRRNAGAPRKVIKFIRANLMAEWILANYPVNGVFIIRNPLAVVASMKKEGWSLPPAWIRNLLNDRRFKGDFLDPLPGVRELRHRELSLVEAQSAFWCLHNLIPREIGHWGKIPLVVYEEMCRDPERVVRELAPRLGFELSPTVLAQCHRPSFMAGKRPESSEYGPTTAWKHLLACEAVDEIIDVVERFGMTEFLPDG